MKSAFLASARFRLEDRALHFHFLGLLWVTPYKPKYLFLFTQFHSQNGMSIYVLLNFNFESIIN